MKPDMARRSRVCWSVTFADAELSAPVTEEAKAPAAPGAEVDKKALSRIGYGLYVVTVHDGMKDTGCIVNSVVQAADKPLCVSVCINKANYTCEAAAKTGILNINCLSTEAPFSLFQNFGFQSGRSVNKFDGYLDTLLRSANGLVVLPHYINAFMSLKVMQTVDLGSHTMFLCEVTEAGVVSGADTMTYAYYQQNVKPKTRKTGWVCKVCGYVYEGGELPEDFVCPVCKHDAGNFEKVKQ